MSADTSRAAGKRKNRIKNKKQKKKRTKASQDHDAASGGPAGALLGASPDLPTEPSPSASKGGGGDRPDVKDILLGPNAPEVVVGVDEFQAVEPLAPDEAVFARRYRDIKELSREKYPEVPRTFREEAATHRLYVVLERCCLETIKVGNEYQLLNSEDHKGLLRKFGKDIADARPDITHQCLLTLLDSPLNQAGRLQIFLHTERNVLIRVDPRTRIPRTFKRFSSLMVQLLHKLRIRAAQEHGPPIKLLDVIKNPVTDHLPPGCLKIGTSVSAEKIVHIGAFVSALPRDRSVCFVVGGMARGSVEVDYLDKEIGFSQYHLSASVAVGKICCAFEDLWGII